MPRRRMQHRAEKIAGTLKQALRPRYSRNSTVRQCTDPALFLQPQFCEPMQPRLLTVLRCPVTLEPLDLEIIEQTEVFRDTTHASGALVPPADDREPEVIAGWLTAAKRGYRYPIVDGVPRLLVDTRLARPTDP